MKLQYLKISSWYQVKNYDDNYNDDDVMTMTTTMMVTVVVVVTIVSILEKNDHVIETIHNSLHIIYHNISPAKLHKNYTSPYPLMRILS